MSKYDGHTPGPWLLSYYDSRIAHWEVKYKDSNSREWLLCVPSDTGRPDEDKANGALIADAPDLLRQRDALIEVINKAFTQYETDGFIDIDTYEALEQALADADDA